MKDERLAVRVSGAFLDGLDQLVEQEGTSRAEVVRRAVALYAHARKETAAGSRLAFIREEDGQSRVREVVTL